MGELVCEICNDNQIRSRDSGADGDYTGGAGGTLLASYDFGNPTGQSGTYAPSENYPFSTGTLERWTNHTLRSEVITGCDGDGPYSGTHFYHHQFMMGYADPCLGTTTTSTDMNSRCNIGMNLAYPLGSQDTFVLEGAAQTNTLVFRCRFRCTGNWTSQNNVVDSGGGLKFVRIFGDGGDGDSAAALLKLENDGDSTDPAWNLYDPVPPHNFKFYSGIDVQDGEWHTVCFRAVRNADDGSEGNVTTTFWIDDWDMAGPGQSNTITCSLYGADFKYIELFANFSGTGAYPDYPISIDVDYIEVWDGMP
jgi:hypothetical protein